MDNTDYGITRAINELRSIFSCQWSNGMLPQIRFLPGQYGYRPDADDWAVPPSASGPTRYETSGITQPPIIGLCLYEAFNKLDPQQQEAHRDDFLALSSALEKYHKWLLDERDPWQENLLLCLHPWETGTDNSPAFDPLIHTTRQYIEASHLPVDTFGRADTSHVNREQRPTDRDYFAYFGLLSLFKKHDYDQHAIIADSPFLLQDVLFNSVFVASLRSLALLQEALGQLGTPGQAGLADKNRAKASDVSRAIRSKLWNPADSFFYSYDARGDHLLKTPTVSGLMPLTANIAAPQQAAGLMVHLQDPHQFCSGYPLPSTSLSSPAFDPVRYWSGPSWPVTNWLVLRGLEEHNPKLAEELCGRTLEMIREGTDYETARNAAVAVLEKNSVGEEFTTPSTRQYQHGWLWDSAIVASSWPLVRSRPRPSPTSISEQVPCFWEYYEPHTGKGLGAPQMSWTASLFLELLEMDSGQNKKP